MSATTIKISLGTDVRRIGLSEINFNQLADLIKSLYGEALSAPYTLKYLDDEKELVRISSELELQEAFRQAHNNNTILKITVIPAAQNTQNTPASKCEKKQSKCEKKWGCSSWKNSENSECQQRSGRCWWGRNCSQSSGCSKDTKCQDSAATQQSGSQRSCGGWWGRKSCASKSQSNESGSGCQRSWGRRWCSQQSSAPTPVSTPVSSSPVNSSPSTPSAPVVENHNQNSNQLLYPDLAHVVLNTATKEQSPYEDKLKQLSEMGFNNREQNIQLLIKRNGNVLQVVKDIVDP